MDAVAAFRLMTEAMTLSVAIFAILALMFDREKRTDQSIMLAAILGVAGAGATDDLLRAWDFYRNAPHLFGALWPTKLAFGPLVFTYTLAMTSEAATDWWRAFVRAGLVTLAGYGLLFSYFSLDATIKATLASSQLTSPLVTGEPFEQEELAAAFAAYLAFTLFFLVTSLGFIAASWRTLKTHTCAISNRFSNTEAVSLRWLYGMLILTTVMWLGASIEPVLDIFVAEPQWLDTTIKTLDLVWIAMFAFFGLLQPPIFSASAAAEAAPEPQKYGRSSLAADRMDRIAQNLDRAMRATALFRNPSLCLRDLADALGVSENHLSQTLNERIGLNFFDYVNRLRVEDAKQRLRASKATILTISYDVGFNSRSTFNAAFKKHAGTTPTAYREGEPAAANTLEPSPIAPQTAS